MLNVDDLGSGFALTVQGVAHLDVQRVGEYMLTALRHVVSALQHAPTTPLQAVSILPPSERHQVLVGFNATARQYPRNLLSRNCLKPRRWPALKRRRRCRASCH